MIRIKRSNLNNWVKGGADEKTRNFQIRSDSFDAYDNLRNIFDRI